MAIYIPPNQHVLIPGRTGSGKTYLAKKYLAGYRNVVALDTKGTLVWQEIPGTKWDLGKQPYPKFDLVDGGKELTLVERLADLPKVKTPKIIYRPRLEEMNEDFYNEFFKWCYLRRNTIVWVDEVMSICPGPSKIPFYYQGILTRGRELGVSVWSLTQRPKTIPLVIISESSHFFVFDLNMAEDRERLMEVTGCPQLGQKPGQYNFWYYKVDAEKAILATLQEGR